MTTMNGGFSKYSTVENRYHQKNVAGMKQAVASNPWAVVIASEGDGSKPPVEIPFSTPSVASSGQSELGQ